MVDWDWKLRLMVGRVTERINMTSKVPRRGYFIHICSPPPKSVHFGLSLFERWVRGNSGGDLDLDWIYVVWFAGRFHINCIAKATCILILQAITLKCGRACSPPIPVQKHGKDAPPTKDKVNSKGSPTLHCTVKFAHSTAMALWSRSSMTLNAPLMATIC